MASDQRLVNRKTEEGSVAAVICAAGSSKRMGGVKKEYRLLPGSNLTVLGAAVSAFIAVPEVSTIIIAVPDEGEIEESTSRKALPPELLSGNNTPIIHFIPGGKTRRASVFNALTKLSKISSKDNTPGYVLIHDGARPWINTGLIESLIAEVKKYGAVIPLLPLTETPKEVDMPLTNAVFPVFIKRHLKRVCIGVAQTPQAFSFPEIFCAHKKAAGREEIEYTDDAEVWAAFYGPVAVIPGEPENRKITFPEDLC